MRNSEQIITRRDFLKFIGAVATVGVINGLVIKDASGITRVKNPDYSQFNFKPIVINSDNLKTPFPTATSFPEISLSPDEQRIQDLQNETGQYVQIAQESGKINDKWINDLKMYGPIYIAVAEKFGIDWKMLFVTHERESGASTKDSKAFNGSTYPYVGGMQRNQEIWPDKFVKEAFTGLEYLKVIPTTHESDREELAGAGAMMGPNMKKYQKLGRRKAVFNTFALFTGSEEQAQERLNIWIMIDNVFSFHR